MLTGKQALRRVSYMGIVLSLMVTGLAGCNSQSSNNDSATMQNACIVNDVRQRCILESAALVLSRIEDPFTWVTSAAELAIAYDANGDSQRAWTLFQQALARTSQIADVKKHNTALSDIALALSKVSFSTAATDVIDELERHASTLEDTDKLTDIKGKLLTARAIQGDVLVAFELATRLPAESAAQDAFKGRTLREIAAVFARQGDYNSALIAINSIKANFTYYAAIARTDVAAIAIKDGKKEFATSLLQDAEQIGLMQNNGYFSAGVLRDIGYSYVLAEEPPLATGYFNDAREAARNANSFQERARAMSRIATKMSDGRQMQDVAEILQESLVLARQEKSEMMRNYALYEIAGSASFSQQFKLSQQLVDEIPDTPFGSAGSLKSASQRDLAWGLVRTGNTTGGLIAAHAIGSKREKVHALSRIVRLLNEPEMVALPRYL